MNSDWIYVRRAVFAALWIFAFLGGLTLYRRLYRHELVAHEFEGLAYLGVGCLLFISIPAAIGSFFGRAVWGLAAGFIAFVLYAGWIMFYLSFWGGT